MKILYLRNSSLQIQWFFCHANARNLQLHDPEYYAISIITDLVCVSRFALVMPSSGSFLFAGRMPVILTMHLHYVVELSACVIKKGPVLLCYLICLPALTVHPLLPQTIFNQHADIALLHCFISLPALSFWSIKQAQKLSS